MLNALLTICVVVVAHGASLGTLVAALPSAATPLAPKVLGAATAQQFPVAPVVQRPTPSVTAVPVHAPQPPQRRSEAPQLVLPDTHAAAVVDAASGALLYDQNAHTHRAIASLTKLFTAYIVRTSGVALDAPVEIHEDDLLRVGSRVGCKSSTVCEGQQLVPGEVVTVRDLLTAMLVASANDAAVALARYIAGSQEAFVALMNARAQDVGLTDSHFCTPNGLEVDGETCYSSAADIGRIGVLAIHDTLIWQLLNTPRATITSRDGAYTHELVATNKLAGTPRVAGMLGAKTGFTPQAGKSLLMAVAHPERSDVRIVAVLLGNPWRWRDINTLVDWTWQAYQWQ